MNALDRGSTRFVAKTLGRHEKLCRDEAVGDSVVAMYCFSRYNVYSALPVVQQVVLAASQCRPCREQYIVKTKHS